MKDNKDKQMAIKHCRFMKDRNYRNFLSCKSLLEKELSSLSVKSEEELTKKDLLLLISRNCDYMRALSLYNYYKDELTRLVADNEGR